MDSASPSIAIPSSFREYELYRLIVHFYHTIEDLRTLTHYLQLPATHFPQDQLKAFAAHIIDVCRHQGRLDQIAQAMSRQLRSKLQQDAEGLNLMWFEKDFFTNRRIAVCASARKGKVLSRVVAGTVEFIDDALRSATECYRSVTSALDRCSALVLVVDDEKAARSALGGKLPAFLAFDCAFVYGLPIYLLYPNNSRSTVVEEWITKFKLLTRLGRANLAWQEYSNDDQIYMAVSDLFAPRRELADQLQTSIFPGTPIPGKNPQAARLFISYAHKDRGDCEKLIQHITPLRPKFVAEIWTDEKIVAGEEFTTEISDKIHHADIILFLQSARLLASEFIKTKEIPLAMERYKRGEAGIISVILKPCQWKDGELRNLKVLPTDGKPVSQWKTKDEAFNNVANGIKRAVQRWRSRSTGKGSIRTDFEWTF